jgi:hypothetical protein
MEPVGGRYEARVARARMLSKTISTDDRVAQLPCPVARLLFSWLIAHADNCGRLRAEPGLVRNLVLPRESGVTDQDVADSQVASSSGRP